MFTLERYVDILNNAQENGYEFIRFTRQIKGIPKNSAKCLLRHDIDADLTAALEMAKVEHRVNIKSTYFLMLQSPVYNLFSRWNYLQVQKIISLGHYMGLHYDRGFDIRLGISNEETEHRISRHIEILEDEFGCIVDAVSFHQPDNQIINQEFKISSRINTYDFESLKHFEYHSDSNREFKSIHFRDLKVGALSTNYPRNIQLLVHPIWWIYNQESTVKAWNEAILNNLHHMQGQMLETERAYGPRRDFRINC